MTTVPGASSATSSGPGATAPAASQTPAASAAGTPPAATGADVAAAGQVPASGQPAPPTGDAWKPEGLPDHLIGKSDREIAEGLLKQNKGFREAVAKNPPPPANAAEYAFDWSDKVKPFTADLGNDDFMKGMRGVLHKAGLNNQQASLTMNGAMELMLDLNLVDQPVDVAAELAKLTPADAQGLPQPEREAAIQRRVSANIAFVDALTREGFSAEAAGALKAELAAFPELNQLVEHMRNGIGVKPALAGNAAPAVSENDLWKREQDPRSRSSSPNYDPAYVAETTALYKKLYP